MQKQIHLAPQTAEEDAYTPSSAISTREFKILRKRVAEDKAQLLAQITVTAEQIQLMASKTYVDGIKANLEASITVNAEAITLKASQSELNSLGNRVTTAESTLTVQADSIATKVSTTDLNTALSNYSTITQTADAISTRVATTDYTGNEIASRINQTATTIQLEASKINLNGYVTVQALGQAGETTINGSNITTGTISADRIAANSISASKLNISSLSAINANVGTLTAGKIGGWNINSSTISRDKIELGSNYISLTGTSTADATINFYNPNYNTTSRIYSYDQSKALGVDATVVRFTGGITLDGQLTCYGVSSISSTYPRSDSLYNLGSSDRRWLNGYFDNINGSITTASDINLKTDIKEISNGVELILNLKPVQYKYKEGRSGRNHYGFIAQELKETMSLVGIPDAGVYVDLALAPQEGDDVNLLYKGLRYYELIAPMIQTIQYLNEKIKVLEDVRTL